MRFSILVLSLLTFLNTHTAVAKNSAKSGPSRGLASLAPKGVKSIGDTRRSVFLDSNTYVPNSREFSARSRTTNRSQPTLILEQNERSVPRVGTLSPQFNYADIAVQVR